MSHSLRVRLKKLQRTGELTERDIDRIFKALEQEPCEDCISRQAVDEQINCWIGSGEYRYTNATDYLTRRIKELSSVQLQPRTGYWINKKDGVECSACNENFTDAYMMSRQYCPCCGSKNGIKR